MKKLLTHLLLFLSFFQFAHAESSVFISDDGPSVIYSTNDAVKDSKILNCKNLEGKTFNLINLDTLKEVIEFHFKEEGEEEEYDEPTEGESQADSSSDCPEGEPPESFDKLFI